MTFCRQKFKHCFVACCASVLNKSSFSDQENIVAQFPNELQKDTPNEGVPKSQNEVAAVVVGLGISANPELIVSKRNSYEGITQFLKANKLHAERMMCFTKHPTNHTFRIKQIDDGGLTIMDPEQHDFTPMTWEAFEKTQPTILLL